MTEEFKFQIGESVVAKVALEALKISLAVNGLSMPRIYKVLERTAQECPGGVQRSYVLSDLEVRHTANEIEISPFDDACADAIIKSIAEARKEKS